MFHNQRNLITLGSDLTSLFPLMTKMTHFALKLPNLWLETRLVSEEADRLKYYSVNCQSLAASLCRPVLLIMTMNRNWQP